MLPQMLRAPRPDPAPGPEPNDPEANYMQTAYTFLFGTVGGSSTCGIWAREKDESPRADSGWQHWGLPQRPGDTSDEHTDSASVYSMPYSVPETDAEYRSPPHGEHSLQGNQEFYIDSFVEPDDFPFQAALAHATGPVGSRFPPPPPRQRQAGSLPPPRTRRGKAVATTPALPVPERGTSLVPSAEATPSATRRRPSIVRRWSCSPESPKTSFRI